MLAERKGRRAASAGKSAKSSALNRALRYLGHYPRLTTISLVSMLVATLTQLAVPQLIQNMIDAIVNNFIRKNLLILPANIQQIAADKLGLSFTTLQADLDSAVKALIIAGGVVVGFSALRGVFAFVQTYTSQILSQEIAFELRNDLFAKIQRLSFSYHDRNQTGQLMIRATDDIERLRLFIGQGALAFIQSIVLLVGTLILLFAANIKLTLVILPILPATVVIFMIFGSKAQPLFRVVQERLDKVNMVLQENMAGLKVVKAFASETREEQRFDSSVNSLLEQNISVTRLFSFLFPFIFLVANLGQVAVLYFGGRQMLDGTLTLGEWQKFSLYLIYLFIPMGQLGFIISLVAQAAASADRIFEILDTRNDVENALDAKVLPSIQGKVVFDDVAFRYFTGSDDVLKRITFTAEPGETIALLGSTGSGKTTIINLIPRFYDVSEGSISIDGFDIRHITIESLRSQIGIVLQETTLFSGTIRENIAFGRPNASDEEIQHAAKAAAAHDFIMTFPQGYDTPVGERGSTLSGGQKQRLAIARALLLDPRILILDDSTSSVDLNTEYQIQQALDTLMKGRTSFVIAQRISTVLNADKILVLDKGEIADIGTHEQLMEKSALYAEIYHSQLSE